MNRNKRNQRRTRQHKRSNTKKPITKSPTRKSLKHTSFDSPITRQIPSLESMKSNKSNVTNTSRTPILATQNNTQKMAARSHITSPPMRPFIPPPMPPVNNNFFTMKKKPKPMRQFIPPPMPPVKRRVKPKPIRLPTTQRHRVSMQTAPPNYLSVPGNYVSGMGASPAISSGQQTKLFTGASLPNIRANFSAAKKGPSPKKKTPPPSQTFYTLTPDIQSTISLSPSEYKAQTREWEKIKRKQAARSNNYPPAITGPSTAPKIYKYRKGSRWSDPEYDDMLLALQKGCDAGIGYKTMWTFVQNEMCSGRPASSIRGEFKKLVDPQSKYNYRSEECCAINKRLGQVKSQSADTSEKQVVHRLQHKLAKQKETREEAKAHKKASREALTSGIINVCGMLEKDMNVQKNKELQAMALKMNQKRTTKAIRTVIDTVEDIHMADEANELNKADLKTVRKAILKAPEEICDEYQRVVGRYLGRYDEDDDVVGLVVKLLQTAQLLNL